MAGYYTIGTKLGYDLANGLQVGQSVTAPDKSVWTKNQDGTISVLQNGVQKIGKIEYQPEPPVATQAKVNTGYESPYKTQLDQAIENLNNSQWQGWNKDEDPNYQAYRKAYLREADRTMQDTLGQYAQNTGGIAGSSAINAASQAADYQKAQLTDKIPELYDAAYSRYLNDMQLKQQKVNALLSAESQNSNLYYQQISYALQKWAQMGYADAEVANALGVAEGTPTSDQAYTDWSKNFKTTSGGVVSKQEEDKNYTYDDLFMMAYSSGQPTMWASANAKKYGFEKNDFVDAYDDWLEKGGPDYNGNEIGYDTTVFNWVKRYLDESPDDLPDPNFFRKQIDANTNWNETQKQEAMEIWQIMVDGGYIGMGKAARNAFLKNMGLT